MRNRVLLAVTSVPPTKESRTLTQIFKLSLYVQPALSRSLNPLAGMQAGICAPFYLSMKERSMPDIDRVTNIR